MIPELRGRKRHHGARVHGHGRSSVAMQCVIEVRYYGRPGRHSVTYVVDLRTGDLERKLRGEPPSFLSPQ